MCVTNVWHWCPSSVHTKLMIRICSMSAPHMSTIVGPSRRGPGSLRLRFKYWMHACKHSVLDNGAIWKPDNFSFRRFMSLTLDVDCGHVGYIWATMYLAIDIAAMPCHAMHLMHLESFFHLQVIPCHHLLGTGQHTCAILLNMYMSYSTRTHVHWTFIHVNYCIELISYWINETQLLQAKQMQPNHDAFATLNHMHEGRITLTIILYSHKFSLLFMDCNWAGCKRYFVYIEGQ